MRALSKRLDIYLGDNLPGSRPSQDFYDTFVLTGPGGEVVAHVRKSPPASFEAYSHRRRQSLPLVRFADRSYRCSAFATRMRSTNRMPSCHQAQIDLYLRPFSWPSFEVQFPIRQRDVEVLNAALREGTAQTARLMGIPVVMSNKVGRLVSTVPAGFPSQDMEYPGFSAVADSDGSLLDQLGPGEQGVVVGTVQPPSERQE